MAKAPAVVIIVRHGARLDAADKSWHLTSPAPYDPPLTYGGWVQSRALGLRIASLLHAREREVEGSPAPDTGHFADEAAHHGKGKDRQKKRKHKVMIHSSPFQRCVQTSVGIGAGLSQYQGMPTNSRKGSDLRIKTVSQLHSASPRLNAVDSHRLESIPEPLHRISDVREHNSHAAKDHTPPEKATLRVDAFLGEWLSPDYFEHITHPPNSTMMVAGAKANLLRKSDNIETYKPTVSKATGMWGTPTPTSPTSPTESSHDARRSFSRRDRASSLSASPNKTSTSRSSHSPFRSHTETSYVPPTPTYAVSPADPIPRGYVAHAKDACLNVDYQWDSMRSPHYWGDGGNYGEEWSAMHKRFRRGLNNMIEWYCEESDAKELDRKEHDGHDDDDEDEADLVLVLVTHGAGCNALIGALTNQPVLIDVGMASLTMAARRGDATFTPSTSGVTTPALEDTDPVGHRRPPVRRNSTDRGLSTVYDMKIVASSEHLRPGVDPANASIPAPSSPLLGAQKAPEYRRRYNSGSVGSTGSAAAHAAAGAPLDQNFNPKESMLSRSASTTGPSGMRRGSVAGGAPQRMRTYSLAASAQVHSAMEEMKIHAHSPSGLWSSPTLEKPPSPGRDFALDFSHSPEGSRPSSRPSSRPPSAPSSRPTSRPQSQAGSRLMSPSETPTDEVSPRGTPLGSQTPVEREAADLQEAAEIEQERDSAVSDLPTVGSSVPHSLGRSLSQKGLWGSAPSGLVSRENTIPKRRWTLQQGN